MPENRMLIQHRRTMMWINTKDEGLCNGSHDGLGKYCCIYHITCFNISFSIILLCSKIHGATFRQSSNAFPHVNTKVYKICKVCRTNSFHILQYFLNKLHDFTKQ